MPDTSLPQIQLWDPNGFTNSLAAGMKMRQIQNESDRLAYKDEAALAKSNALRKFGMSDRGPEAVRQLYIDAPDAAPAVEKQIRDAGFSAAQTDKLTSEAAGKKMAVIGQILSGVTDDATYQQARAQVIEIEPSAAKSWPERYDPAFIKITQRRGIALEKQIGIDQAQAKLDAPKWDSYTGRYVTPPAAGAGPEAAPTVAPPGPLAAQGRRPTMVPGGTSGYSTEEIKAEIARIDQGGAPSEHFRMSREELGGLLLAQTDLENAQGGGASPPTDVSGPPASPVDGEPAPVQPTPLGGPQAPVVYRTPAERDAARDQRQDLRDAATDQRYVAQQDATNRRLDIAEQRQAAADKKAQYANEIASGQRLTPADASKVQQKLVRIEAMKRQLALVKDAWAGTKDEKGSQTTKGIKGTMAAGPGADLYAPDLFNEGGEKFNKAVASLASSKTAMLRTPGVGTMSDYDQKLDVADLPSRNTHEGTTEQQIQAYENMIADMESGYRALLVGPAAAPAEPGPTVSAQVSPQTDRPSPKPVKEFDAMPMPGEYAGKRIKTPDGGVYRSNGRQWVPQ